MANLDLSKYGITGVTEIVHNPSYDVLFAEETKPGLEGFEKGQVTNMGAVNVMTGVYTGRSPKDKFFVKDETSENTVWWTSEEYKNDNKPVDAKCWAAVKDLATKELSNKRLFVVDAFCGANENSRLKLRFIMEVAWQAHFVTNMFIRPTAEELANFGEPDFVIMNASKAKVENYKELGLNSETAVVFNLTEKIQVILNTWYGGEMKKGMFSYMNYLLPLNGMASMHCSANTDKEGKSSAIFFGLSGTGKTTLSTDPKRLLIGDDEHGWDDMFIRPTAEELANFGEPDFVIMNASKAKVENYKELGLNSETAVVFNLTEKIQVILNTWYGGEMKKGMFSYMNYLLPLNGMASMHCSANTDKEGKSSAIFFGLSGTGKTTLSTDPKRKLIGDDEHGWDNEGVFNYEGGCYAKVINLDKDSEPDIYNAIKRDALLENVTVDANGKIDFTDKSVTENTRVSYPIYHIENIVKPVSKGPHAKQVIFLSADAFGVLPPVSILNPEQAQYYFLSGFTAKLAGTERGITEPTPTFSACFGAAFLSLHPTKYAEELVKKMEKTGAKAYLVNTGWNGTGKRISIRDTRGIIDAILDGSIDKAPTKVIPYFDFVVPTELPGVDPKILDPRDTYADAAQWDEKAKDLAGRFIKNFAKFTGNEAGKKLVAAGPKL